MKAQIKFGTSGWRAIMADEFTVENVRRAVTGIARYVSSSKPSGARVIVGRDPRFLGETFVALAADVLAGHGIEIGRASCRERVEWSVVAVSVEQRVGMTGVVQLIYFVLYDEVDCVA